MTRPKITNHSAHPVSVTNSQTRGFGIAYEMTYRGVTSYLFATVHKTNAEMIKQSCFHRIMENVQTLYTELGTSIFITTPHLSIPERNHAYRHIEYRFSLDEAITLEAVHRNLPIFSLDFNQGIASRDEDRDWWIQQINTRDTQSIEKELMDAADQKAQEPIFLAAHFFHMKGEVAALGAFSTPEFRAYINADFREERWFQILHPIQKPTCIAVGGAHLVGIEGLAHRFRKAG